MFLKFAILKYGAKWDISKSLIGLGIAECPFGAEWAGNVVHLSP